MKTIYNVAITAAVSIAAVIGVLVALAAYQEAETQNELEEIVIDLDTVYFDDIEEMQNDMALEKTTPQTQEP